MSAPSPSAVVLVVSLWFISGFPLPATVPPTSAIDQARKGAAAREPALSALDACPEGA